MPIQIESLTVVRIGGHEFYLRLDPALDRDTIVVRDQTTIAALGSALDAHQTPASERQRGKVRTGFSRTMTLGGSREEIATALRQRGDALSTVERTILELAADGRSLKEIARGTQLPLSAVARARRAAATKLGFTLRQYPQNGHRA